jgi:polar amino acid transport system ATP-binding protein
MIVTHEMQFAKAIADSVVFIDGGEIVEKGAPSDFFVRPKTERANKFLNIFNFD